MHIKTYECVRIIPNQKNTRNLEKAFVKQTENFYYDANENILKYRVGADQHLRFYTIGKAQFKLDYIELIYATNDHAGRDRLKSLENIVYGVSRQEIMSVLRSCMIC